MSDSPKADGAVTLASVPTCDLQWELERREGVQSKRLGIDARIEVLIDGSVWVRERGPLTVSVNQD